MQVTLFHLRLRRTVSKFHFRPKVLICFNLDPPRPELSSDQQNDPSVFLIARSHPSSQLLRTLLTEPWKDWEQGDAARRGMQNFRHAVYTNSDT